ncbi:MAG: hypothetical protein K6E22_11235 [Treponema sp.]|nr:hypothetical protein [Treponema sp.]
MKFTPPICPSIFKLFAVTVILFAFASCSHTEEEGSVSFSIPHSVCKQIAARAPVSTESTAMKVFVTGDWQTTKMVPITGDSSVTIEFDGIPSGSRLHVICLIEGVPDEYYGTVGSCKIGASNEIVISGKYENSVQLSLEDLDFSVDNSSYTLSLSRGLPGCTYRWEFSDIVATTSVQSYTYSGSTTDPFMGYSYCTIYCDGTEITTLSREQH